MNNSELLLALNASLYFFAILYCLRKHKHIVVTGILMLYFLSAVGSYFLFGNVYFDEGKKDLSLFPFLYLFIGLIIMLRPLMKISSDSTGYIEAPDSKSLKTFILIIFVVALPRSIETFMNFDDVIGGLMVDAVDANLVESVGIYDKKSGGGFNFLSIIGGCGYALAPLVLMYYLTQSERKASLVVILVFVSIASVLDGSLKGNRGPLVTFGLQILLLYLFFRPYYSKSFNKKFQLILGGFGAALFFLFYLLSLHKYGLVDNEYLHSKYLIYFSENFIMFDSYGLDAGGIRYGTRTATMVTKLLMPSSPSTYAERMATFTNMKIGEDKFTTFVGDFTLDYGPLLAFIILLATSVFLSNRITRSKNIPFYQTIIVFFIIKLYVAGLFLSPYCNLGGNLQILVFIAAFVWFKKHQGKTVSITK